MSLLKVTRMEHQTRAAMSASAKETSARSGEQQPLMALILDDMRTDLAAAIRGAQNDSEYRRSAVDQGQAANIEIDSLRKSIARVSI